MIKFSFYKIKTYAGYNAGNYEFVGLKNYIDLFKKGTILSTLKNSLYYLVGALIQTVLALYLATVLSFKVKGGDIFKGIMFFPYLIIYIQNYLGIKDYAIVLGVVLIFASVVSVVSGRFIDRVGKMRFTVPAAAIMLIGLAAMYFVRGNAGVMIAGSVMMSGYMMMSAALGANIRDWTPKDKAGHFQGIRMIFAVLLPMIIGPAIGAEVIRNSDSTYMELGAAVLMLTAIPVLMLRKSEKKR